MKANYTAGEASRLAGFEKPWMLGHLEREGIFVREHFTDRRHGRAKKYTFADIVVLRAINRMLVLGARPARIKQVIAGIGKLDGLNGSQRSAQAVPACSSMNAKLSYRGKKRSLICFATANLRSASCSIFERRFVQQQELQLCTRSSVVISGRWIRSC